MRIETLRREYSKLTPRERLAALTAAALREDDQETEALLNTAPKHNYTVSDHYFTALCFDDLAYIHMTQQLDAGVAMSIGMAAAIALEDDLADKDNPETEARLDAIWDGMKKLGGQILARESGWLQFCEDLKIDGRRYLEHLPGGGPDKYDSLNYVLLQAQIANTGGASPDPEAAEAYQAEYQAAFDKFSKG